MMLQHLTMLFLLISAVFCLTSQRVLAEQSPATPLKVIQVERPLRSSYEGAVCTQVVIQHNFAFSYGTPFIGKPRDSPTINVHFYAKTLG